MRLSIVGLFAGLILGLAAAFGGFGRFLIVALLGAIGVVVGKVLDGELDLTPYLGNRDRGRQ